MKIFKKFLRALVGGIRTCEGTLEAMTGRMNAHELNNQAALLQ